MKLTDIHSVFFVGIGGIGMSALARFFRARNVAVAGYDKTATTLTSQLIDEGANITFSDTVETLVQGVDLVIYTPAISKDSAIMQWYTQEGYTIMKRSQVLGLITNSGLAICVAGTHGKTSISTMIAHILRHSGYGCNAFLGGIAANYNTNYWSSDRNVFVVEADEFDRSFLQLHPNIAVVSTTDPDHLDIYGTEAIFKQAFLDFVQLIDKDGILLYNHKETPLFKTFDGNKLSYGLNATNTNIDIQGTVTASTGGFTVQHQDGTISEYTMTVGGLHNIENMVAAITVAKQLGIDGAAIKNAVEAYIGVKRRFEYIVDDFDQNKLVYIDDYAHHPVELNALLKSIKFKYPTNTCTVIFQPHLFSRTQDFADQFAEVLALADKIILLPIYPAREQPIDGVNSNWLASKMGQKAIVVEPENLLEHIDINNDEIIVTAGAGDIDKQVPLLKAYLKKQLLTKI